MDISNAISKWFWALCMLASFLYGAIYRFQGRKLIERNPYLEEGYKKILKGFLIWGNLPWVVMAIGCTVGGVPSVLHYFNPMTGNPYVLFFYLSVFIVWVAGSYWILFCGGARALVEHPGLFNLNIESPALLKLVWIAGIFGGIIGFFMMSASEIPIPIE